MAEHVTHDIVFKQQKGGATSPAKMEVLAFSEKERKARGIQALLGLWAVAIVCVFIPVAHFVLVPGFLIAGVYVARKRWNTPEEGIAASGACPACGNEIRLDLEKSAELPQWHDCPQCGEPLELRAAESS